MSVEHIPIWLEVIIAFGWAAFSGVLAYLQQFAHPENRRHFSWWTAAIKSLTAGFVGVLTVLLLSKQGIDIYFLAFLVGIAGWGGAETVAFFQEIFRGTVQKLAGSKQAGES